jgi:hypothetical protein
MPLGIIDDAEEHTFCVKKKYPHVKNTYHEIFWVTWMEYT